MDPIRVYQFSSYVSRVKELPRRHVLTNVNATYVIVTNTLFCFHDAGCKFSPYTYEYDSAPVNHQCGDTCILKHCRDMIRVLYSVNNTHILYTRNPYDTWRLLVDSFVEEGYGETLLHDVSIKATTVGERRHPQVQRRDKGILKGRRIQSGVFSYSENKFETQIYIWLYIFHLANFLCKSTIYSTEIYKF